MKERRDFVATVTGIYCITNLINGKRYVGQSVDVFRRGTQHIHTAQNGEESEMQLIHKAMRKYGTQNFRFDLLCICPRHELTYWERYCILKLNTLSWGKDAQGYNVSLPDDTNTTYYPAPDEVPDYVFDICNDLMNTNLSYKQIAQKRYIKATIIEEIDMGNHYPLECYKYPLRKKYQQYTKQKSLPIREPKVHLTLKEVELMLGSNRNFEEISKTKGVKYPDFLYWRDYYGV